MAHKLAIIGGKNGMQHIWNVSQTVGTQNSEVNSPTDVELVKLMCSMYAAKRQSTTMVPSCYSSIRSMAVDGNMDVTLGFIIYFTQVEFRFPADGKISVGPRHFNMSFLIHRLNNALREVDTAGWENLPDNPRCSLALKNELQTRKS